MKKESFPETDLEGISSPVVDANHIHDCDLAVTEPPQARPESAVVATTTNNNNNNNDIESGGTTHHHKEKQPSKSSPATDDDDDDDDNDASSSTSSSKKTPPKASPKFRPTRVSLTSIGEETGIGSPRRSSMELRRMPVNVLLNPNCNETTSVLSEDLDEAKPQKKNRRPQRRGRKIDILHTFCLRPKYTLRKQMMLSFGSITIITIAVVVIICIALSIAAGENVKSTAEATTKELAKGSLGYRARYLAESLTEKLILVNTVKYIYEATRDRFDGHPNPTDDNVPFFDIDTNSNMYPIQGPPMPLEWDIVPNVNDENYEEYLQSRWMIYKDIPVDTTNAGFLFQGACDPSETDPLGYAYWPNCTDANNDLRTGGVIAPSETTEMYHRKGSDMVPFFRALFEEWEVIRDVGLYFLNNGAGAGLNYPHYPSSTQSSYTSIGCDWLLSPNPYDPTRTIGTEEMIEHCHADGEVVSSRLYNPMERAWCRDQALYPNKIFAEAYENAWNPGEWLLFLGKSVYDRTTNDFIACIYLGIGLAQIDGILASSRTSKKAEASVIEYTEEGNIIASSRNFSRGEKVPIYEAGLGLTRKSYGGLFNLVDFESQWNPKDAQTTFETFSVSDGMYFVSAHPMPAIPEEYDPNYRPIFFVITSYHIDDLIESVDALNEKVNNRVTNINTFAVIIGLAGLAISTLIIFSMARVLTAPLTDMNKVANEIVGSFGDSTKEDEIRQSGEVSMKSRCSPQTELSDVVTEFNRMVCSFSGSSEAKSEKYKDDDMINEFPARKELWDLYESRDDNLFKYNPTGERLEKDSGSPIDDHSHEDFNDASCLDSIEYLHFGPNHISSMARQTNEITGDKSVSSISNTGKWSSLFLWVVLLIVTPLLFITILLTAGVMTKINYEFAKSTEDLQVDYLALHKQVMLSYARLRAGYVSSLTENSSNDLHHLTRYTSWLLFGALNQTRSFTQVTTGMEECKVYSDDVEKCDYVRDNFVCDCAWREKGYEDTCRNYTENVRPLLSNFWMSEWSPTDNGDRYTTNFPNSSFSAQTTDWWDDVNSLPGFEKGSSVSGYDTAYDRLRVVSALPLMQPLYHYGLGEGKETTVGLGVGFEADGIVSILYFVAPLLLILIKITQY